MKTKKSAQANLETRRSIFRQMGLIFVLGAVFIAFEYASTEVTSSHVVAASELVIEPDYVPITRAEAPPLPPAPPVFIYELLVVDDNVLIPDEIDPIADLTDINEVPIFDFTIPEEIDSNKIFVIVDKMPQFPGGEKALMQYLREQVRYPSLSIEYGVQGRVYVQFVVNSKGEIVDVEIMKGVDKYLDEEALRVVANMPRWQPGLQSGKAVNVSFQLPINFQLSY